MRKFRLEIAFDDKLHLDWILSEIYTTSVIVGVFPLSPSYSPFHFSLIQSFRGLLNNQPPKNSTSVPEFVLYKDIFLLQSIQNWICLLFSKVAKGGCLSLVKC